MNNTYKSGDKVLIMKSFYTITYNDVLIFEHKNKKMIKRCVGLSGNTFKIINGKIYSNNELIPLPEKAVNKNISESDAFTKAEIYNTFGKNDWTLYNFGPYLIPKKGKKINLDKKNRVLYGKLLDEERVDFRTFENDTDYTFHNDFYFLVGDNRVESVDSRFFGPVKKTDIRGKVIFKVW